MYTGTQAIINKHNDRSSFCHWTAGQGLAQRQCCSETPAHPVSITRFPLRRVSPGAGLLRYVVFHW